MEVSKRHRAKRHSLVPIMVRILLPGMHCKTQSHVPFTLGVILEHTAELLECFYLYRVSLAVQLIPERSVRQNRCMLLGQVFLLGWSSELLGTV